MRARILPFVETKGLTSDNRKELRDQVRNMIYNGLIDFQK